MLGGGEGPPSPSNSWPFKRASSPHEQRHRPQGDRPAHAPRAPPPQHERARAGELRARAYLEGRRAGGRPGCARPAPLALHAAVGPALFFWDSALTSPTLRSWPMSCGRRRLISIRLDPPTPVAPERVGGAGINDRKGPVLQWEARKQPVAPPLTIVSLERGQRISAG